MELSDYLAALQRNWRTWAATTAVSVLIALSLSAALPRTYLATAQVFVASTSESTAGFQFVTQRVKSYLDVVDSPAVLEPVIGELQLDRSLEALRQDVSATNPADTSRVDISVAAADPAQAAAIANAAAERFTRVVEELEAPDESPSPVRLTVTGPASLPASPEFPKVHLLLALGIVVGLFLGAALAVVRSRMDTSLHTAEDVRQAWTAVDGRMPPLLAAPAGTGRRSRPTGRPAMLLARRLDALTEHRPIRVLLLSPAPGDAAAQRLAAEVAEDLRHLGTVAAVSGAVEPPAVDQDGAGNRRARVRLAVGDLLLPVRDLRRLTEQYDAVVLVLAGGLADAAELRAAQDMLDAVQVQPLALVLVPAARARFREPSTTATRPVPDPLPVQERRRPEPVGSA